MFNFLFIKQTNFKLVSKQSA